MATVVSSSFHATATRPQTRPQVSSPLAYGTPARAQPRSAMPVHAKHLSLSSQTSTPPAHLFPTSRPLRPFPSIANSMSRPSVPGATGVKGRKATKIIEPPKNCKTEFVLDLTQAELSRQD